MKTVKEVVEYVRSTVVAEPRTVQFAGTFDHLQSVVDQYGNVELPPEAAMYWLDMVSAFAGALAGLELVSRERAAKGSAVFYVVPPADAGVN